MSDQDDFTHHRIDVGEVTLHVVSAKPKDENAPLVVLLHGFPEFWWSWRHQLRALRDAGIWAVAPDMRGYNESDKPEGVAAYTVEKLSGDVAGLIRALGRRDAIVVGHDWGGNVAWAFAELHPEMLVRLAVLNIPHPSHWLRAFRTKQLRKSWYIFFFQLPWIPERAMAKDDYAFVRKTFRIDGTPPEDIERYIAAIRRRGVAAAALNYYRAAIRRVVRDGPDAQKPVRIDAPVLVIWGDRDRHIGVELAKPPPRLVPNTRIVHFPGASHWVQNDVPDEVNALLIDLARQKS